MDKYWVFTFGYGQVHAGKYVKIKASTYEEARDKMVKKYGTEWAFQYTWDQWTQWMKEPSRAWAMEQELLEVIE